MTITAQIIADSVSPEGKRITTFQLRYPRFIHAELMTHRVFSRNASSSRAIPVAKMIEDLRRDPAMPVYWGSNQPGMQAGAELSEQEIATAKHSWLEAMEMSITHAQDLIMIGLHKQIANRILEPWAHINVVVTSTEWDNFYQLRRHADAQPEIKVLADAMFESQSFSLANLMRPGEWHLPYISAQNWADGRIQLKRNRTTRDEPSHTEIQEFLTKISVARCARVSYLTHDGRPTTVEEDLALYDRLVGSIPLHASPAEHQATPDTMGSFDRWQNRHEQGNFVGWRQYRKLLELQMFEKYESVCATPGCTEDVSDGEVFDGYCGNCADKRDHLYERGSTNV